MSHLNLKYPRIKEVEPTKHIDTDFNVSKYSEEELRSISVDISNEISRRHNIAHDLELLKLKTMYEGKWVIDEDRLYYIIELSDTYCFKYFYLVRDDHDIFDDDLPNYKVGIDLGHGDFLSHFSEDMHILDSDEAGKLIDDYIVELSYFIDTMGEDRW